MAGSLNKVMLIGNLGADPEIRRGQSGNQIVTFRIATSDQWRDKNTGEKRERTEWHSIVIFSEALGKVAEQYLKKGAKVYIEGQLQTRKWQDQSGNDRYSTEVILQGFNATLTMLDSQKGSGYQPGGNGPEDYGQDADRAAGRSGASRQSPSMSQAMDDDIPF